eukprot:GILI01014701.1.p1 GENE.GILI01014701.1~~GILI01014701.1.p1  ORF type:complete len:499 (+),score=137.15 GILI01014701.1:201-1499(+)
MAELDDRRDISASQVASGHAVEKYLADSLKMASQSQWEARHALEALEAEGRHAIEEDEVSDAFSAERSSKDNRRSASSRHRDRELREREELEAIERDEDKERHNTDGLESSESAALRIQADVELKDIHRSLKSKGQQLKLQHSSELVALEDSEYEARAAEEGAEVAERQATRQAADSEAKRHQQFQRDRMIELSASIGNIDIDEDEARAEIEEDEASTRSEMQKSGNVSREASLRRLLSRNELLAAFDLESTARKLLETSEGEDRDTIDMNAATINYNPEYQVRMLANEMPSERAKPLIGFSLTENIDDKTLIVDGIAEGGPAYQVGVRLGDEVVMLEYRKVTTIPEVRKAVDDFCVVGKLTRMVLYRPGSGNFNVKLWMMTADRKYEGKPYFFDETKHNKLVLPRKKKGSVGMTPGGTTAMSSPVARTPNK